LKKNIQFWIVFFVLLIIKSPTTQAKSLYLSVPTINRGFINIVNPCVDLGITDVDYFTGKNTSCRI